MTGAWLSYYGPDASLYCSDGDLAETILAGAIAGGGIVVDEAGRATRAVYAAALGIDLGPAEGDAGKERRLLERALASLADGDDTGNGMPTTPRRASKALASSPCASSPAWPKRRSQGSRGGAGRALARRRLARRLRCRSRDGRQIREPGPPAAGRIRPWIGLSSERLQAVPIKYLSSAPPPSLPR